MGYRTASVLCALLWFGVCGAAAESTDPIEALLGLLAHKDAPVRRGALDGLVALDWRPATEADWQKLGGVGSASLPFLDTLLADADAALRTRSLREAVQIATADAKARDGVVQRLIAAGGSERAAEARSAAARGLLDLKWPASDEELARVFRPASPPWPLIDQLIELSAADLAPRFATALKGLAAQPATRQEATARLAKLPAKAPAPSPEAVARRLQAEGWRPKSAEDWAQLKGLGSHGLAILERLLADKDEAARGHALELLPDVAAKAETPAARKQALDLVETCCDSQEPAWAAKALGALATMAKDDKAMRPSVTARLLAAAMKRPEPPVRQAAFKGLADLGWRPADAEERKRIVAVGRPALPLIAALLDDPDATARTAAMRLVAEIAAQDRTARDEAVQALLGVARADRDAAVIDLATQQLRGLGWPASDPEWAELAGLGTRAARVLHVMVEDKDDAARAKAVDALARVGAAQKDVRAYAAARLTHLARTERSRKVREAVMGGLTRLRWPETDEEWQSLAGLGHSALSLLNCLARNGAPDVSAKAVERARTLAPPLLASAERAVDNQAMLDGLELQWDIAFRDLQKQALDLAAKDQLPMASDLLKKAIADCEETERRVQTLAVESGAWPLGGVANRWRALQQTVEDKALAKLRQTWPLTVNNWLATLRARGAEADEWQRIHEQVDGAPTPAAGLVLLDDYLKKNAQSFYAPFAWKWKDLLARDVGNKP